jgi:sigma-54 dependent transcriptional regulator, acetoin dehydrogenase operon transcriptional activator AcoR
MASRSSRLSGAGEPAEPGDPAAVRRPILAPWRRSRKPHVAGGGLELSFLGASDLESPLARAAVEPVLRTLYDELDGQPVSVVLSNARGLLLCRLAGDQDLERYLAGHGHYAERLDGMARTEVPVLDPVTGETVGVVDLTGWHGQAGQPVLAPARSNPPPVSQPPADSGDRDLRLMREYRRACRQRGGIVIGLGDDVVILNDHARQALSAADQAVLVAHAAEMLQRRRSPGAATVELPSGAAARMFCHPVRGPGDDPGLTPDGVVHVKLLAPDSAAAAVPPPRQPTQLPGLVGGGAVWRRALRQTEAACHHGEWLALEGESGVGKLALIRAVHQRHHPAAPFHVLDAADGGDDLLAQARGELADGSGMLVLRHVHALDAGQARALAVALREAKAAGRDAALRVAVTLEVRAGASTASDSTVRARTAGARTAGASTAGPGTAGARTAGAGTAGAGTAGAGTAGPGTAGLGTAGPSMAGASPAARGAAAGPGEGVEGGERDADAADGRADLLPLFPAVVAVPPLRHHSEDLSELVPFFLGRLSKQGQVSCSPAAMQLLVRYAWPGNAAQLWQVLKQAVQRRRAGQIMPDDLPSEVWTLSRRTLSPLESIQRDAIVQSLLDHGGSKVRAARALGMSRATIYRRIREYGIVT